MLRIRIILGGLILIILSGGLMLSGTITELAPIDYVFWVEDPEHGLKVSASDGLMNHTLQYRPLDYIVAKEEKRDELPLSILNKRKSELEGMQYYTLRLESPDKNQDVLTVGMNGMEDYQARVNYLAYEMQEDLYLVEGQDTLYPHLYHFERRYGLTPFVDILLGFEHSEQSELNDKTLMVNNRMTGTEPVELTISKEALNHLPSITTY